MKKYAVLILVALIFTATVSVLFAEEANKSFPVPPLQGSSQNWVRYDQNSVCWHKGGGVTDEYRMNNPSVTYYANLGQIEVFAPATACQETIDGQGKVWRVWEGSLFG